MGSKTKILLVLLITPVLLLLNKSFCRAYSFSSYGIGDTTFFSGDVSGSAYNIGDTTFYNLNGKSYSSYNIGDTTFYSGSGISGTSYSIGDTTFHNIDGTRFTSYDIGSTTFYSGDISGSSYNIGDTSFYTTRLNTLPYRTSYTPKYYSTYYFRKPYSILTSGYNLNLFSDVSAGVNQNLNMAPTQTYGGTNGEPTFYSKEAYEYWKKIKEHPSESLSESFDAGAVEDASMVGSAGVPNIISLTNLGGGNVNVNWTNVQDAEKYYIFYGQASGNYPYMTSVGGTTTSQNIGGLVSGSKYYFTIQAQFSKDTINRGGNNDYYSLKGKEMSIVVK